MAKTIAQPKSSSKAPIQETQTSSKTNASQDQLSELLASGIKELYWIENHLLLQVLPKVQESFTNPTLKKAILQHTKVTKGHIARLSQIFTLLNLPAEAKKSDGLEGLAIEGEGIINSTPSGTSARDTGLIMACQKVETYEITAYKGLALLAAQLGQQEIAGLLQQTMAEEQEAQDILSSFAEKQ